MGEKMEDMFKGYSNYSNDEYAEIWKEGMIVLDTNILLNFYRYSKETRDELYNTLKKLKKRLWIPYQVAQEYFNNKSNVISTVFKTFNDLSNKIKKEQDIIINEIRKKPEKQMECKKKIIDKLNNCFSEVYNIIDEEAKKQKDTSTEEVVEKMIFSLFNDVVGPKIEGDEYEQIKEEGHKRFKSQTPPGYKDDAKEENGDYYIFYSMIKYAKEKNKHIIFVTDDTKEDWFVKVLGERRGGDYRLLNEFYKETRKLLLIYTSDGFLKEYNKQINNSNKITDKILDELIKIRTDENNEYLFNMIKKEKWKRTLAEITDALYLDARKHRYIDNLPKPEGDPIEYCKEELYMLKEIAYEIRDKKTIKMWLDLLYQELDKFIKHLKYMGLDNKFLYIRLLKLKYFINEHMEDEENIIYIKKSITSRINALIEYLIEKEGMEA